MTTSPPSSTPRFPFLGIDDLRRQAKGQASWLWHGYLAPRSVTLLTSQWKAGKTTLLTHLLRHMRAGGQLLGLPVLPGKAVVLTEESPALWCQRGERFDLSGHVFWLCRPFLGKPRPADWTALIDDVLSLHAQVGLDLFVIDPLASFLATRSENDATAMLNALLPLLRLTEAGLSVLLQHHPRKKLSADGRSARGSGALLGWVDVLIEMHFSGDPSTEVRRRLLLAWSRHDDTPRRRLVELNADATDYFVCSEQEEAPEEQLPLLEVLQSSPTKLTRREVLDQWPAGEKRPSPVTLWRMLDRCVERDELLRDGTGTWNDPFRYWLPSLEERWRTDVVARSLQASADASRYVLNLVQPIRARE